MKKSKLVEKFEGLTVALNAAFVDRGPVVEGMVCAALAGEHVLLLGPPGTAKSALANQFCGAIQGAQFFGWLLSKFTAPEELFGPISLESLKRDMYKRVTTAKLPEAHVVFLDEIFKANSAILNTLLTAVNERKFHNNGGATAIPLRMVVGASNELPEGPELGAIYDRFLVRYWVEYVRTPDAFLRVVMGQEPTIPPQLTVGDWERACAEVSKVQVLAPTAQTLFRLKSELERANVTASDRRWKRAVKLVQANAWMSGDAEVFPEHFSVLAHALWGEPEQRGPVAEAVTKVSQSVGLEAQSILQAVAAVLEQIPAPPKQDSEKDEYRKKIVSATQEANRALTKLRELKSKARNERQTEQVQTQITALEDRMAPVRAAAREALGL